MTHGSAGSVPDDPGELLRFWLWHENRQTVRSFLHLRLRYLDGGALTDEKAKCLLAVILCPYEFPGSPMSK